ncbi:IQ domain-containing protein F2-like isoform X2 [Hemicordylus capensis]|uniref:IQ domain-containing protein F2-like isoform X2 n=1 Tax=Hemicordylus capensis TaxID=884348 RepID=UPI00230264C6|nr:IQ domain-containing protein F2-like isoform X2 [Hemicordylus capensis]
MLPCCRRRERRSRTSIEKPIETETTETDYQREKRECKAAVTIQKWWRGELVRRTLLQAAIYVRVIQKWWSCVVWRLRKEKRLRALVKYTWPTKACVLMQSVIRMWLLRIQYRKIHKAVLIIQKHWRHYCFWKDSSLCAGINASDDGIDLNIEIVVE